MKYNNKDIMNNDGKQIDNNWEVTINNKYVLLLFFIQ